MSEFDGKQWYVVVDNKTRPGIYRLTYQISSDRAIEVAGSSFKNPRATSLTWRGIQALTECEIPSFSAMDSLANDPLIFEIQHRTVVIYG